MKAREPSLIGHVACKTTLECFLKLFITPFTRVALEISTQISTTLELSNFVELFVFRIRDCDNFEL